MSFDTNGFVCIASYMQFCYVCFCRTRSYKKKQLLVPVGHLWVEGDNAQRSKDCNSFGPVRIIKL